MRKKVKLLRTDPRESRSPVDDPPSENGHPDFDLGDARFRNLEEVLGEDHQIRERAHRDLSAGICANGVFDAQSFLRIPPALGTAIEILPRDHRVDPGKWIQRAIGPSAAENEPSVRTEKASGRERSSFSGHPVRGCGPRRKPNNVAPSFDGRMRRSIAAAPAIDSAVRMLVMPNR